MVLLAIEDPRRRYRAARALAALEPLLETTLVAATPELVIADEPARIAQLRQAHPAALLLMLLTERGDAAGALDAGADGVLERDAPAELRARVRALLRRLSSVAPGGVAVGPLQIDVRARRVALAGAPLPLRPREFALLACLASEPGRVFTKRELLRRCWSGHEPPARSRALETQIFRLRRRLGRHAALLVTVWSVGYVLTEPR
ncbi:MAG: winged helix-turn-helix domain-containing protein [Solirubrobacteraceae bacterium]